MLSVVWAILAPTSELERSLREKNWQSGYDKIVNYHYVQLIAVVGRCNFSWYFTKTVNEKKTLCVLLLNRS